MQKRTILKMLLMIVAIPVSFAMAFIGALPFEKLGLRTPGMLASNVFVPPSHSPHEFDAVADGLKVQIVVDWVFWLAVICGLYVLFARFGRKSGQTR